MKKAMSEAILISQCISGFLNDYAPKHKNSLSFTKGSFAFEKIYI